MKWYDYDYLEEIKVRREDQKLYKFKEGEFPRLNLRDIEDMMLLLWVEDLQLGVESYQKKLNITKPETFRLMRSDKLYKFSDGALTSVRSVLHDIASNLRMDYLPKKKWSNLDKQSDEVLKLKNFKKDGYTSFQNQEKYEHVGQKVTISQEGKDNKMAKRDYAWLMISRSSRSHTSIGVVQILGASSKKPQLLQPHEWIDEGMVVAEDLHLLRDGSKDDSEEESPAEDSDVVGGYMVENE
nr:hypothetical protein [Tanacetum cinerariifolium]